MVRIPVRSARPRKAILIPWLVALLVRASVAAGPPPLSERIDQVVAAGYRGPEIPLAGDLDFLRRVFLDLIGRGPAIEEINAYLAKIELRPVASQTVRWEVIDDLLQRDEFARHYAGVFDVMFTERREKISVPEFRGFIRQWLEDKRPLNELCLEILAADGTGERWRPAASFFLNRDAEPNLITRDVGRIFFGRDVQCAQCHDHPLVADYEQSEFFGILSFVNRTYLFNDEKRGKMPLLGEKADGQLEFASVFDAERKKSPAQPVLPMVMAMDAEPMFVSDADAYVVPPEKDRRAVPRYSRRQQLAVLATHPENQSFNRNLANRIWANLMGTGIVHPVDMHHTGNPPASAALLRLLAGELVACHYDLREMLRQIARSRTYQRSLVAPQLESWEGPIDGLPGLEAELQGLDRRLAELTPRQSSFTGEFDEATGALSRAQADVTRVQQQVDREKTALQQQITDREAEATKLSGIQTRQKQAQELVASLTSALAESEKVVALRPNDQELVAARDLLKTRRMAATESAKVLENERSEQQEVLTKAENRVEDQKGRILALANRRLALGEFVVEARGVLRRVRIRQQALIDEQSDLDEQRRRIMQLKDWLELRNQVRQAATTAAAPDAQVRQANLKLVETGLVATWRRTNALRQIRGLTAEQLTSTLFHALERDRPVRSKVQSEWASSAPQGSNPQGNNDLARKIAAAVAAQQEGMEDLLVGRFASPAGTPQDGFFATADQALTLQNDPSFLAWLAPDEGTLIHRLGAMEDNRQMIRTAYLCLLTRLPADDEIDHIDGRLSQAALDRPAFIRELAWGVLASTEFRFIP